MTPTQEDREAAAQLTMVLAECFDKEPQIVDCLAGKHDSGPLVQAFTRHRIAAEERGARMALEAAAKVAEENKWPDRMVDASWADGDITPSVHNQACEEVATAIHLIDPAALGAG